MKHYMHNVPGRLRVRNQLFKNEQSHQQVRLSLSTLAGIRSSEFKMRTGSLVVVYDPSTIQGNDIVRALERAGHFDSARAITNDEYIHNAVSKAGKFVSRALFGSAVDVALQGTGLGWVGLLI